jgi:hypothetical protein
VNQSKEACAQEVSRIKLRRREDISPFDASKIYENKSVVTDEQRFEKFVWLMLHGLPYRLHTFQKAFYDYILQVLAEYLLGDSWES